MEKITNEKIRGIKFSLNVDFPTNDYSCEALPEHFEYFMCADRGSHDSHVKGHDSEMEAR